MILNQAIYGDVTCILKEFEMLWICANGNSYFQDMIRSFVCYPAGHIRMMHAGTRPDNSHLGPDGRYETLMVKIVKYSPLESGFIYERL